MKLIDKIKVLIVDDSIVFREVLSKGLASEPRIEIVDVAKDPFDARDKILKHKPDVMTCDVEMPKMNGIEFIRQLLPQYSIPVIIVSSVSNSVFDAMSAGAVDFVAKPDINSVNNVKKFIGEMINKVKIVSNATVIQKSPKSTIPNNIKGLSNTETERIIAMGASTGGTEAIFQVLKALPESSPGIVIAQHIPPVFSAMFAERLNSTTKLNVKEAKTGDWVEQGCVLIAPGNLHMIIKKVGDRYRVECFEGEKVNGHRPSVDVLFESVAKQAGSSAIGAIMTGMGYDGARGLLSMKKAGAKTIGQDEESCVVYGMPKVAFNIGAVEKQSPLSNIAHSICSMLNED